MKNKGSKIFNYAVVITITVLSAFGIFREIKSIQLEYVDLKSAVVPLIIFFLNMLLVFIMAIVLLKRGLNYKISFSRTILEAGWLVFIFVGEFSLIMYKDYVIYIYLLIAFICIVKIVFDTIQKIKLDHINKG